MDVRAIRKRGSRLFHGEIPIERIYNRAIVDELERRGESRLPFDWRDDLDVEWAGHPNWFFRLSKFSLPYLRHPAAPRAQFLDQAGRDRIARAVRAEAALVLRRPGRSGGADAAKTSRPFPRKRRRDYLLQERVDFAPVIETPAGMAKIEVRIMYLYLDELLAVNTIVRMGRGAQMGVDHNKGLEWVGGSAGFLA